MHHLLITATALFLVSLCQARADTAIADGKPLAPGSPYYTAGRACLASMATARAWAKSELGDDGPWLGEPVTCDVAVDTGCGSAMTGHELQFLTGQGTHCGAAVFIPAYVYHEWAHGLNHELAGVRLPELDEALADTFAVYLTGNPRFGEGEYKDREHSWQRDLSERKIYDGPTKQLYTQSETLSGAWWDFRVRLVNRLGRVEGAKLAALVYFQHLRELGGTGGEKTLEDDYDFARAAVSDLAAPVLCELFNSFADHGLASVEDGCARAPLVTDVDQITALLEGRGVVQASASQAFPVSIPDKATLTFRFRVKAPTGSRVKALALDAHISYPYSDDLLVRVTAPDGRTHHDIYKGEEELAVPALLTDRFAFSGAVANGVWTVELVNAGQGLSGSVDELGLKVILR